VNRFAVISLAWVVAMRGQSLKVMSEFQRIGSDGAVVAADRMETPREILSPLVARNAFTSYHLVVRGEPGAPFALHVGQNPERVVQVTLYKEIYLADGIPDLLQQVLLPYEGTVGESGKAVFWMDTFIASDAPVRRIKVEPQVSIKDMWVTYPMEVRIGDPIVPVHQMRSALLPAPAARSDVATYGAWRELVCGVPEQLGKDRVVTIRSLIHRNVQQDIALARKVGVDSAWPGLLEAAGMNDVKTWCAATQTPPIEGVPAEWYLRVRDFLYRAALH